MSLSIQDLKQNRILTNNIGAFLRTYDDDNEFELIQGIINIIKLWMGVQDVRLKDTHNMSLAMFELMSKINFVSSKNQMNDDFKKMIDRFKI